jgi:cytochrome c-type biogenesis protein CcmE
MKPYMKFGILIAVVVSTLAWLAVGGVEDTKTYYKTVPEIRQMGSAAMNKRLRVGGDVVKGSIQRNGKEVSFDIVQIGSEGKGGEMLRVVYSGNEPLPDTFRDGAQALADGRMNADGSFTASRIQAKCASKYEGKPGQIKPGSEPAYGKPEVTKRS